MRHMQPPPPVGTMTDAYGYDPANRGDHDPREEYRQLIAERDALIADGISPDVLVMPVDPDNPDPLMALEAKATPTRPCDGCNVRQPWEHRCHGEPCPCEECAEERRLFPRPRR